MAKKLVDLEEAAKMLGIPPETLSEMRSRQEITAYRDGSNWKFKAEDIERLAQERAASAQDEGEFAELEEPNESILLSEIEMGDSSAGASSTIIGKSYAPPSPDSDIQLVQPGDSKSGSGMGSDLPLPGGSSILQTGGSSVLPGGSGVLPGGSGVLSGSGLSSKFDELDALDLDLPSPSESGLGLGSSGLKKAASSSDLTLDDKDLSLPEAPSDDTLATDDIKLGGSSVKGGSAIELTAEEDDELVLGGPASNDVTRSASDSGIGLMDPSDSGLSLDEAPLELGGSAVESLELGEDDLLSLDEPVKIGSSKKRKVEDDFLLTPLEEGSLEDSSDSGSQVIGLDESEGDDASATLLVSGSPGGLKMEPEPSLSSGLGEDLGMAAALRPSPAATAAPAGAMFAAPRTAEVNYSVWNILALTLPFIVLALTGMMMYDLVRNMWSWEGPYSFSSEMMNKISGLF